MLLQTTKHIHRYKADKHTHYMTEPLSENIHPIFNHVIYNIIMRECAEDRLLCTTGTHKNTDLSRSFRDKILPLPFPTLMS